MILQVSNATSEQETQENIKMDPDCNLLQEVGREASCDNS